MEKLQSNVVCVCVCVLLNATGNLSGEWWCRLRHRGPDWSGLFVGDGGGCYLAHERLAIIDPASGDQPLFNETKEIVVAVRSSLPPFSLNVALFNFILFWYNFISAVEMCVDSAGKWLLHLCYWRRSFWSTGCACCSGERRNLQPWASQGWNAETQLSHTEWLWSYCSSGVYLLRCSLSLSLLYFWHRV